MKKMIGLILPLAIAAGVAHATIYTWKDVNGKTVYSDHPPASTLHKGPVKEFKAKPAPPSEPLKAVSASQGAANANASQAPLKKVEEQNTAIRTENCKRARYNMAVLEANLSRSLQRASGTNLPPSAEQRDTVRQLSQAQKDVTANCSNQQ